MFFYFVVFCIIGFFLGVILKNFKIAMAVVVTITLCWAAVYGPWAVATFIELMLGFTVARVVAKEIKG